MQYLQGLGPGRTKKENKRNNVKVPAEHSTRRKAKKKWKKPSIQSLHPPSLHPLHPSIPPPIHPSIPPPLHASILMSPTLSCDNNNSVLVLVRNRIKTLPAMYSLHLYDFFDAILIEMWADAASFSDADVLFQFLLRTFHALFRGLVIPATVHADFGFSGSILNFPWLK